MPLAYIGIGSNIDDARANVDGGVLALSSLGVVLARSSRYRTAPWGVREQDDFINAVVALETTSAPLDLLRAVQKIETEAGRLPTYRWGPRVLDLDLLTYDDLTLRTPELTLPHPRLFERAFVLAPLAEISPAYASAYERLSSEAKAEVLRLP